MNRNGNQKARSATLFQFYHVSDFSSLTTRHLELTNLGRGNLLYFDQDYQNFQQYRTEIFPPSFQTSRHLKPTSPH